MKVDISTFLPREPGEVERHLRTPRLLVHIAAPLMKFVPCGTAQLPEMWEERTYWFSILLFGFVPLGRQAVAISYPATQPGFSIRDNGHSMLIKKWDHLVTIEPSAAGTLYRDQVTIKAGVFTLFIWVFAQLFFRHRQRRWRQLVANDFDYSAIS